VAGLVLLGYVVFQARFSANNLVSVASYYVPRLSLVLFIELFAYFFLNLYKSSLSEVKYFQNEMTNIEVRFTALGVALEAGDDELVREVTAELAKTERNFISGQGLDDCRIADGFRKDGCFEKNHPLKHVPPESFQFQVHRLILPIKVLEHEVVLISWTGVSYALWCCHTVGLMFCLRRNRLVGSYLFFNSPSGS